MSSWPSAGLYTQDSFVREAKNMLGQIEQCDSVEEAREQLFDWVSRRYYQAGNRAPLLASWEEIRVRDCAQVLLCLFRPSSEERAGFSVVEALWDLARNRPREDLGAGFFAEMTHLIKGIEARSPSPLPDDFQTLGELSGREAALARSDELDSLWEAAQVKMRTYVHGLSDEARIRRAKRRDQVLEGLGGRPEDWSDWRWHVEQVLTTADQIARAVPLDAAELETVARARDCHLPFGVTPYYASLMDEKASDRDRGIRSQVLPPPSYVREMEKHRSDRKEAFDFMGEHDTSPIDLVTRRYPAILILKPYNTCPQVCVYCQRNWEIDEAMDPKALAPWEKIEEALKWIEGHPAIREVLITGGDPLTMDDDLVEKILTRVASIEAVDLIRIGSRTPVTLPMRITENLAALLGKFREPGRRELCLITHVEHAYEITPEMVTAVDRLKKQGIGVFNQLVYTFFTSRRFEASRLRMLLRRIGIDPYYTFVTKGKEETNDYRVPLARLLQEQKEEARLLPGTRRTDEVVYNVPRLGKNHARAHQHRDLIGFSADGERIYEFHPWEKNVVQRDSYVGNDVSILEYLSRLAAVGEDPDDYRSIWYYY